MRFFASDMFGGVTRAYDLIVCNPPYVSEEEYASLTEDVRNYEPKLALAAGGRIRVLPAHRGVKPRSISVTAACSYWRSARSRRKPWRRCSRGTLAASRVSRITKGGTASSRPEKSWIVMFEKLDEYKKKFSQLESELSRAETIANPELYAKLAKEHASLSDIVSQYDAYNAVRRQIADLKQMEADSDPEIAAMAREELAALQPEEKRLTEELKLLLLPKDPNDERNVVLEIRAGTGGDEAALFGGDLLRMYLRYAERTGYGVEWLSTNMTELGGVKEVTLLITGRGAYSRLKYESGVHRVQRVPETESSGRIHTSAATVAVLPEARDVDVEINPADLRIDVYRSSGHGGQSVNTTDSAVRVTHIPSGLVVTCQDEKSQLKNKDKALKVLKARLYDMAKQAQESEMSQNRKSQVGSGDRSERIRTYNFPQGRVTDHRISLTLYRLEQFLDGDMDEMIDALILDEKTKALSVQE